MCLKGLVTAAFESSETLYKLRLMAMSASSYTVCLPTHLCLHTFIYAYIHVRTYICIPVALIHKR